MPLTQCAEHGCRELVEHGRCDAHKRVRTQANDQRRGSARERGYTPRWDAAAKAYLRFNPLCVYCAERGIDTPSECVDHRTPHRGDMDLFWDADNWAAACIACNSSKGDGTVAEWRRNR